MIVFNSLRLLCVRAVDVMTSLPSFCQWLCCQRDCLNPVSCMLYKDSVNSLMDQGCNVLCILSVVAFCMSHALSL